MRIRRWRSLSSHIYTPTRFCLLFLASKLVRRRPICTQRGRPRYHHSWRRYPVLSSLSSVTRWLYSLLSKLVAARFCQAYTASSRTRSSCASMSVYLLAGLILRASFCFFRWRIRCCNHLLALLSYHTAVSSSVSISHRVSSSFTTLHRC